jgi:hypothetical protein
LSHCDSCTTSDVHDSKPIYYSYSIPEIKRKKVGNYFHGLGREQPMSRDPKVLNKGFFFFIIIAIFLTVLWG